MSEQGELLSRATHIILQPKTFTLSPDDIKAIKESRAACVSMTYLSACITSAETPSVKPYLVKL